MPRTDVVVVSGGQITHKTARDADPIIDSIRSFHAHTTYTASVCTGALLLGDVTALREVVAAKLGVVTLHGPMLAADSFVNSAAAQEHLRATPFEPESVQVMSSPAEQPAANGLVAASRSASRRAAARRC